MKYLGRVRFGDYVYDGDTEQGIPHTFNPINLASIGAPYNDTNSTNSSGHVRVYELEVTCSNISQVYYSNQLGIKFLKLKENLVKAQNSYPKNLIKIIKKH